jgi:hypothetical protein
MNFAYADPPYLGCGKRYKEHPAWDEYDGLEAHQRLIKRLEGSYGGWAMSLHEPSMAKILPLISVEYRLGIWVKPFSVFKPNVNPSYSWEPVVFSGGRKRGRDMPTLRNFVSANITLRKGVVGAKPPEFCFWMFEWLNIQDGDEFEDLFPGSNGVMDAYKVWRNRLL